MVMGSEREVGVVVAMDERAIEEQVPVRRVDCSAMKQMSLPDLLYYVLVGDGKRVTASS